MKPTTWKPDGLVMHVGAYSVHVFREEPGATTHAGAAYDWRGDIVGDGYGYPSKVKARRAAEKWIKAQP